MLQPKACYFNSLEIHKDSKEAKMQLDFHFYTIYVLCRCNGMSPENAKKVAYASQHTDDAKHEHALKFENGGRFQQILSAHKIFDIDAVSSESQHRIYVPFHFIPGNHGDRIRERMVCKENSDIAQMMVQEVATLKDKPYQLHRLGIALHVYADTWSHQEFSGLHSEVNDVEVKEVFNEDESVFSEILGIFGGITDFLTPQIGHAKAGHLTDEPFRDWKFYNAYQDRNMTRKNWVLCENASKEIYEQVKSFLANNSQFKDEQSIPWDSIKSTIVSLFKQKGDIETRCQNWAETINDSRFGFECQAGEKDLPYDDREWFKEAVEVKEVPTKVDEKRKIKKYWRKDDFHLSDWKYFHDAAASHRFFVLHEILAPEGIVCG